MKIIVADDEKDLERMYRPMFIRRGYSDVKFILTPDLAIEAIKADSPDIAVLDINFEKEIDGFEVMRQTKPFCPNTRFIMASAYAEYRDKALAAGAHGYLLKPLEMKELFALIKNYEENPVT